MMMNWIKVISCGDMYNKYYSTDKVFIKSFSSYVCSISLPFAEENNRLITNRRFFYEHKEIINCLHCGLYSSGGV